MSKKSKQEQLKQLLIAAKFTADDIGVAADEAKRDLVVNQQKLQREHENPTWTRRKLDLKLEEVATLQRIVDLSNEISQLADSEAAASEQTWTGQLHVAEHKNGRDGCGLRVFHDPALQLAWQASPSHLAVSPATICHSVTTFSIPTAFLQVVLQAKVIGPNFKVGAACILADVALLGGARAVIYPGCKLDNCCPSCDDGVFIVLDIKIGAQSVRCCYL
jgi:hypothetical protein